MAITKIQSESLNLADDFAFTGTITGAGVTNTPLFYVKRYGSASYANNTTTKITYLNEVIDTDNTFDFSNHKWIPSQTGYYIHLFRGGGSAGAGESIHQHHIRKNGSSMTGNYQLGSIGAVGYYNSTLGFGHDTNAWFVNITENLNSDYYEMFFYHNQGGNVNYYGDWLCYKIS